MVREPVQPRSFVYWQIGSAAQRQNRSKAGAWRMTTRLDGALKREITVAGAPYTLTITPTGFTLVPKGKRKGYEMTWEAFVAGDEALAVALAASMRNGPIENLGSGEGSRSPAGKAPRKAAKKK